MTLTGCVSIVACRHLLLILILILILIRMTLD